MCLAMTGSVSASAIQRPMALKLVSQVFLPSGHLGTCLVSSRGSPQRGHLLCVQFLRSFIILPVEQWLVANLAFHLLWPTPCSALAFWAAGQLMSSHCWLVIENGKVCGI